MGQVRAKFKCEERTEMEHGLKYVFSPVTVGSDENSEFFKWTPYGKLEMGVVNPRVSFTPGKMYYLVFTEAE